MKKGTLFLLLFAFAGMLCISQTKPLTQFGKICWEESAIPLRPGIPGKRPFWNIYAERFIYAPAFNFKD